MTSEKQTYLDTLASQSRRRVMSRLGNGDVDISDIQTLCLLSIIGFNGGRFSQASLDLSTASHLANTSSTAPDTSRASELVQCVHAVTLLRHFQGTVVTMPETKHLSALDCSNRTASSSSITGSRSLEHDPYQHGLLKCTSELAHVWYMARAYATRRPQDDEPPPWFPQSDFSKVMMGHLRIDSTIPREFRYVSSRFADQDLSALQQKRHYWLPWLTVQMLYAAIPCLLNHPLLLSIRLRNFRDAMPQSFIQQSWEQVTRHAGWIMHFVDLLEAKLLEIVEPTLAHCVVIVATIHLQHSFVQDLDLRTRSQEGFQKCLRFVRLVGKTWPIVAAMVCISRDSLACERDFPELITAQADNLEAAWTSVTPSDRAYDCSDDERPFWSMDVQLLARLLLLETAGQRVGYTDSSLRSTTLLPKTNNIHTQITSSGGFDLIGSTGISGHRSVRKDAPLSAPQSSDRSRHSVVTDVDFFASIIPDISGQAGLLGNPVIDSGSGATRGGANMFIPENEYSRSIGDWFGVDLV